MASLRLFGTIKQLNNNFRFIKCSSSTGKYYLNIKKKLLA